MGPLARSSRYARGLCHRDRCAGNLLSWPATCLVFRSWLVFPIFLYFLVFAVLRGAQEERVLREQFNTEFEAYRQRAWRLVPYVY
jgi:protein-S-isoprenylcysteine O-methyltransferase Ste14